MSDMPTKGQLIENDHLVQVLRRSVKDGGIGLREVPEFLKKVLKEERWKTRVLEQGGRVVEFDSFEEFVTTRPLEGMGTTVDLLRRICVDDPEAIDLLDRALHKKPGGDQRRSNKASELYNVQFASKGAATGNARAAALRRLRSERPDLHAQVLAGKLTAHGAMVEAGLRPKTVTVSLDPEKAAETLFAAAKRHGIDWSDFKAAINAVSDAPSHKAPSKKKSVRSPVDKASKKQTPKVAAKTKRRGK
jgi:hypothetical protein